jgi:hypothetical protein
MGAYVVALVATLFALFTLALFGKLERHLGNASERKPPVRNVKGTEQTEQNQTPPGAEG